MYSSVYKIQIKVTLSSTKSWPYVKESAYESLVRPILEYGSSVSDPHCNGLNGELENVQKRAARFVTKILAANLTDSMNCILEELKWETLQKRGKDNRLILLYKGPEFLQLTLSKKKQALQKSTLNGLSYSLC